MLGYTGLAIFGAVALNPDWGIMNKNTTLRTIHKWTGRLLTLLSWVVCVLGLIKMQPSQTVVQILFTAPLLYFGFVTLL